MADRPGLRDRCVLREGRAGGIVFGRQVRDGTVQCRGGWLGKVRTPSN